MQCLPLGSGLSAQHHVCEVWRQVSECPPFLRLRGISLCDYTDLVSRVIC